MELGERIVKGLRSDPKYLPSCLEWGTKEADALFQSRKEAPGYDRHEEVPLITSAFTDLAARLGDSPVIVVEIGAGVSPKTVTLLKILTEQSEGDILYMPIDLDPGIQSLSESLNNQLKRQIEVIPLLKDVLEGLEDFEKIRNKRGWPAVFAMFGPTTIVLPFERMLNLSLKIGSILNGDRHLGFLFTYRMDVDHAVEMTNACFLQSVLPDYKERYMKLFLNQLVQTHGFKLETSDFTPATDFKRKVPVLDGETADAFCFYAESLKDQSIMLGDGQEEIHLAEGERISLFDGCGLRLHFSEGLVHGLAARCQMKVNNIWSTDTLGLVLMNSTAT